MEAMPEPLGAARGVGDGEIEAVAVDDAAFGPEVGVGVGDKGGGGGGGLEGAAVEVKGSRAGADVDGLGLDGFR